jgi:outer membrane immunogenic protein
MRKHLLTSAAVLALSAGAAFASDLPTHKAPPPPPPPPVFSWTGCYVGLHAGGDFGHSDWKFQSGYEVGMNTEGAIGGGQVGCNYQMNNNFVVGGEAEIWGSGLAGSTSMPVPDSEGIYNFKTRSDFAGDVALRGGYAVDRLLLFGKVGVAMAEYQYRITDSDVGFLTGSWSANATHTGLLLGLGVEYALDMHWSIKGEYDYIDWGDGSSTFTGSSGGPGNTSFKNEENILKAGVNYRF